MKFLLIFSIFLFISGYVYSDNGFVVSVLMATIAQWVKLGTSMWVYAGSNSAHTDMVSAVVRS